MASVGTQNFALPLEGKTAIVTGASRGIGAAIAWELAVRGANVCITYVSEGSAKTAEDMAGRIRALPHRPKAHPCRADVSKLDGPEKIMTTLRDLEGPDLKVHILVNNAGIEAQENLGLITAESYSAVFDLNVRGVIMTTQAVLPHMPPRSRIINIASTAARDTLPGLSVYAASKGALEALSRCWATELGGNGTTVNTVNPGPVQSEMLDKIPRSIVGPQLERTPVEKRLGTVEEVARVVAFLASEDSSWITGQAISASGGYSMY